MPRKNSNARTTRQLRPLETVTDAGSTQAPVRTEAADKVWAELHAHPGFTVAELAEHAGVGRSTAGKALTAWESEGTAARTACIASGGRRGADRWAIVPADPDEQPLSPAEAIPLDNDGEPVATDDDTSTADSETTPKEQPSDPEAPAECASHMQEDHTAANTPAPESPRDSETAPSTGADTRARLGKGALRGLVEDHLIEHAGQEFGPTTLGKQLGRSAGAVANALEKLVTEGHVVRTGDIPKRYAATSSHETAHTDTAR